MTLPVPYSQARPPRFWIAVACASHVARGSAGGFIQVCHGKSGPLARIQPGDFLAYYSPTTTMGGRDPCQSFTATGQVTADAPYPFDMGSGFVPWRRNVTWDAATEPAPIRPLLARLALTRGRTNWGQPFRYGLVEINAADFALIAHAMGAAAAAS